MTRRTAFLLTATAILGACGRKSAPPEIVNQPDAPFEIRFAFGRDLSQKDVIRTAATDWNKKPAAERGEATVVPVELGTVADEVQDQLVAVAQGPEAYYYDVMLLDVVWTAQFAHSGFISELDESRFNLAGMVPSVTETGKYGGRRYAIPFKTDAGLLYYRNRALTGRPPPNFGGLKDSVVAAGSRFAGQFYTYEGLTVNTLEIIRHFEGNLAGKNQEEVHEEKKVATALEEIRSGMSAGWLESPKFTEDETWEAFARDDGPLFMRNWPYAHRLVSGDEQEETGGSRDAGRAVKVRPLPWPSVLGGHNLAISPRCRRLASAYSFVQHMTSSVVQHQLFVDGNYPPVLAHTYGEDGLPPHALLILEAVGKAEPRPDTPYYSRVSEVIQKRVADFLFKGNTPADKAVQELAQDLKEALRGG